MPHLILLAALLGGLVAPLGPGAVCHYDGPLPDAQCTPGAVAETDIAVVCHRTTRAVRPPVAITNAIKHERMAAYGVADQDPRSLELDHLIPLELGGAPGAHLDGSTWVADPPLNLWPQPYAGDWGAHRKDTLENRLHEMACAGQITLADAQQAIAQDWVSAYEEFISH